MSDTATSTAADVTTLRRNPGLGQISGRMCIRCGSKHIDQTGWASRPYFGQKRVVCVKCVGEIDARKAARGAA